MRCTSEDGTYLGWAVGDGGLVVRCDLSSDSWSQQYSSITSDLYSLFALNADTTWAVGWNGTVIRIHTGGDFWFKINETGNDYTDIWFFNGTDGYFADSWAGVSSSSDGGESISYSSALRSSRIHYFCFTDQNNGWGCGSNGSILQFGNGVTGVEDEYSSCMSSPVDISISPNPFVSMSTISFNLPQLSTTRVLIY